MKQIAGYIAAYLGAIGLVVGTTLAVNTADASTTTHRLPTIAQLVREGKLTEVSPATGKAIPFNNCESNYASPYWTLTLGSVKYYMEWHPNANPPQVYSTAGGPHTNYCFYVVSGHDYYVIQQAETGNCLAINNGLVPEIMYETGCNINVTTDTWDIGEWFGGSLVDRNDYKCAYGSVNGGITITDDGGHCAAGYGNDGHIVWYSLLAPNSSPRLAAALVVRRPWRVTYVQGPLSRTPNRYRCAVAGLNHNGGTLNLVFSNCRKVRHFSVGAQAALPTNSLPLYNRVYRDYRGHHEIGWFYCGSYTWDRHGFKFLGCPRMHVR